MALSDYLLQYTKDWTNPDDFSTYENREDQVRADIQLLFNEMRDAFNAYLEDLSAGIIPFQYTEEVPENNIQAAIEDVQQQVAKLSLGQIPGRSVSHDKLVFRTLTNDEYAEGSVDNRVLADGSVDDTKLADDSVRASHVKDGELTLAKFADGELSGKADLVSGILERAQKRWRTSFLSFSGQYTLKNTDAETVLILGNATDVSVCLPENTTTDIKPGASVLFVCNGSGTVTFCSEKSNVTLEYAPARSGALVVDKQGASVWLIKTGANQWQALPFGITPSASIPAGSFVEGSVGTADLAAGSVTSEKMAASSVPTAALQDGAVTMEKIAANAISSFYNATIPAGGEASGSPFTQELSVSGLKADETVTVEATSEASAYTAADVFKIEASDNKIKFNAKKKSTVSIPITISVSRCYTANVDTDWTGDSAPYTQDVSVSGIGSTTTAQSSLSVGDGASSAQITAFGAVTGHTISDGKITLRASKKLTTAFPIKITTTETYSATLTTSWTANGAPYVTTVTVNGILASDTPLIDLAPAEEFAEAEKQIEAWGCVYRAVTGDDTITFYATEKPEVAIPIKIKAVRK